jgi:hypothetical protein
MSDDEYLLLLTRLNLLNDESIVAYAKTRRLIEKSRALCGHSLEVRQNKVGRSHSHTPSLE